MGGGASKREQHKDTKSSTDEEKLYSVKATQVDEKPKTEKAESIDSGNSSQTDKVLEVSVVDDNVTQGQKPDHLPTRNDDKLGVENTSTEIVASHPPTAEPNKAESEAGVFCTSHTVTEIDDKGTPVYSTVISLSELSEGKVDKMDDTQQSESETYDKSSTGGGHVKQIVSEIEHTANVDSSDSDTKKGSTKKVTFDSNTTAITGPGVASLPSAGGNKGSHDAGSGAGICVDFGDEISVVTTLSAKGGNQELEQEDSIPTTNPTANADPDPHAISGDSVHPAFENVHLHSVRTKLTEIERLKHDHQWLPHMHETIEAVGETKEITVLETIRDEQRMSVEPTPGNFAVPITPPTPTDKPDITILGPESCKTEDEGSKQHQERGEPENTVVPDETHAEPKENGALQESPLIEEQSAMQEAEGGTSSDKTQLTTCADGQPQLYSSPDANASGTNSTTDVKKNPESGDIIKDNTADSQNQEQIVVPDDTQLIRADVDELLEASLGVPAQSPADTQVQLAQGVQLGDLYRGKISNPNAYTKTNPVYVEDEVEEAKRWSQLETKVSENGSVANRKTENVAEEKRKSGEKEKPAKDELYSDNTLEMQGYDQLITKTITRRRRRRFCYILLAVVVLVCCIGIGVGLAIYFTL